MAKQTINTGTTPNDGTGDTLKVSFTKCNDNFTELYSVPAGNAFTSSSTAPSSPNEGDLWYDLTTGLIYIRVNDDTSSQWVQISPVPASISNGATGSGRLAYVNTSTLEFKPYHGNQLKISGVVYAIPTSGVVGLSISPNMVFLNGTANQPLAANTTYGIFAFLNSGVITADFRTGALHRVSTTTGNEGVEVLSDGAIDYNSHPLIGMCRTNASIQFVDTAANRFVRTWYNDGGIATQNNLTTDRATTSATFVEMHSEIRNEFLLWAGERVVTMFSGVLNNTVAGNPAYGGIAYNGTTLEAHSATMSNPPSASYQFQHSKQIIKEGLSEGYNYATLLMRVSSTGTATASGAGAGITSITNASTTLSCFTRK